MPAPGCNITEIVCFRNLSSRSLSSRLPSGSGPDHAVLLLGEQALVGGQGRAVYQGQIEFIFNFDRKEDNNLEMPRSFFFSIEKVPFEGTVPVHRYLKLIP